MLDRRLLYVVATARAGSFTAAADRVGVTQSAITKSVADLERQLGYQVFTRTARGVIPTDQGRLFVERAARICDEAQELLRGTVAGSDPYAGPLRIGVCPASIEWLLVDPLSTLMARHPTIRLDIKAANVERVVEQLRSGAIDVALGFEAAFEEKADLRRYPLPAMRTTFFVRQGHPILDLTEVTTADLARYDMITPSESRPYDAFMRLIYEEAGIDAQTRLHFIDHFGIVTRLVANSDTMGVVSLRYAETPAFQRRFARVPFLDEKPLAPLCIAIRSRWSPRPAARAFIKACREQLPSPATLGQ